MEQGGKREFKVREAGVSDPPVPLHFMTLLFSTRDDDSMTDSMTINLMLVLRWAGR